MTFEHEHVITHRPSKGLCTGMMLVDRPPQARSHHVCVNLSRRDVGMAEHSLYAAQIRSSIQQVRRKTMPQHMRREVMENPYFFPVLFQQRPEHLARHGASPRAYKKIRTCPPGLEHDRPA